MKKHNQVLIYILTSLIGILFVISYALYSRLNNLNKTLDQLFISNSEKDLRQINSLIFESHFKDDLVLSNFNISITIIIAFFTALIALAGFFSFKRIETDINELKELKNELETINKTLIETKSNLLEINLDSLDSKIGLNTAQLLNYIAEKTNQKFEMFNIVNLLSNSFSYLYEIESLDYYYNENNNSKSTAWFYKQFDDQFNTMIIDTLNYLQSNRRHVSKEQLLLLQSFIQSVLEDPNTSLIYKTTQNFIKLNDFINQNTH